MFTNSGQPGRSAQHCLRPRHVAAVVELERHPLCGKILYTDRIGA